jgi:hypothetical protein
MIKNQTKEFSSEIDWQPLDNVVRAWVALTGFQNDQQNYAELADLYNYKNV